MSMNNIQAVLCSRILCTNAWLLESCPPVNMRIKVVTVVFVHKECFSNTTWTNFGGKSTTWQAMKNIIVKPVLIMNLAKFSPVYIADVGLAQ